jgi:hypothetical protein
MRSWHRGNALACFCTAVFAHRAPRRGGRSPLFGGRALLILCLTSTFASAQSTQKPASKKASAPRANELTLAGLRPGQDSLARAAQLNKEFGRGKELTGDQTVWFDQCRDESLTVDNDKQKQIEVIRAAAWGGSTADCAGVPPGPWKTGHGLRVGDAVAKVFQLYGEPDSRSPSTRDGQPLELLYYAFDWAGPDVPQVMEVLCSKEKDGGPGRVVEITLAAPSL